jgi:DNA invertase Pin-like site-specific DNA recombinase
MIVGYSKLTGRPDPDMIDGIRRELIEAGAETVFVDTDARWQAAGPHDPQHGLETAIANLAPGDTLLTLSPGHLAGSVSELIAIAGRLTTMGAALRVMKIAGNQALDTGTPEGRLMLGALGLLASFDRPAAAAQQSHSVSSMFGASAMSGSMMMSESFAPRRPRGRPPTASTQASEIARLRAAGMRATDIAERLNICRASVYRVLNLGTTEPQSMQSASKTLVQTEH